MENQENIVYTYRYIWQVKDAGENNLQVRYVTDSLEGHARFIKQLQDTENIERCMREYQGEINCAFIGYTETVKGTQKENEEKGEEKEDEKIS